ncbi:MAG TPA: hypothetical protein VHK90_15825 [Thermoanaerobaculia bacterium]|nr:hypothetical protein [Thermoanaerobaculia bacterium]
MMLEAHPRVVLTASIAAGPGGTFSVDIDDAAAVLREEECMRFVLHYYARVLFELVRTQRSVRSLPLWMAALAQSELDPDVDLFTVAGIDGSLVRHISAPIARVEVALRLAGVRNREVTGDLTPLRGSTLARSVLAVCQAVLPRLSPAMRDAVPAALANMNASYEMTHRYADPVSQKEVPELAYLAASFV